MVIELKLLNYDEIQPRAYQSTIAETASKKNTLVVLPTGMGKTLISILVGIDRLEKFPDSKILITAPSRPLNAQHKKSFEKFTTIDPEAIVLITGKVKPDEREKIYQKAKVIAATPQCVDGKTDIFITDKGPASIGKFIENLPLKPIKYGEKDGYYADLNVNILGYKDNLLQNTKAIKAWKILSKETIKITTELKTELECTPEHPLLTIDKNGDISWIKAEDLSENDFIAMVKKIKLPSRKMSIFKILQNNEKLRVANKKLILKLLKKHKKMGLRRGDINKYKRMTMPLNVFFNLVKKCKFCVPDVLYVTNNTGKSKPIKLQKYIDRKICYVIGAMLGDGHIGNRPHKGREVVFSALDKPSIMSKFSGCVLNIFGLRPKKRMKGLVYYSTALAELFIAIGVPPGRKASKIRVPRYVFELNEKAVYGFISGLFDTDGSAAKHTISVASISHKLIKDLRWLFLKLGIVSSIRTYKPNIIIEGRRINSKPLYIISVSGEKHLNQLLRKCNFDKSKCKVLVKSLKNIKRSGTRFKEILPIPTLLRDIYKEHRKKGGERLDEVVNTYNMNAFSHNSLKKILKKLKSNDVHKIEKLMNLPIRWVRVKTIKKNESKKWVYDLTIENEHNFIGNWIINHNTVRNDLRNERLNFENFSFITFDEAHRCVKDYAYTSVAKKYMLQAKHPLILGLTASPGGSAERINDICKNLFIDAVEIRSEVDEDVEPYIKAVKKELVYVDLPPEFQNVKVFLDGCLRDNLAWLKERNFLKTLRPPKKQLLALQNKIASRYIRGSKNYFLMWVVIRLAEAIKIEHAIELLETQGISPLHQYLKKLESSKKRTDKHLFKDPRMKGAFKVVEELETKKLEHPKLERLRCIVKELVQANPGVKIIIFANYRFTVDKINKLLEKEGIKSEILIGQATKEGMGLTQEKQIETLKRFAAGEFNVLVATSIGEEGLDVIATNIAIFYEPVPSEIRSLQRRGRVGRQIAGEVIFLITKETRDEAYYWSGFSKEKKMKKILYRMKEKGLKKKKTTLLDWTRDIG